MTAFKNHFSAQTSERKYEKNRLPSETIPDQTMSIREILTRFVKGQPLGGNPSMQFDVEDEDTHDMFAEVDFDRMSLPEKEEFTRLKNMELRDLKQKLNQKAAEIKAAKAEAKEKARQQYPKKTPAEQPPAGTTTTVQEE
ncbi:MAG: hypothetical protein [Microvirus sp.]|nr:MAG: hypothetical protein [Microvirus sp.]